MSAVTTSSGFAPSLGGYADHAAAWDAIATPCRYWPCDLLSAFMLQMAANGQSVIEAMMLGSREYACEKLALAAASQDPTLRSLSAQMIAYFDDEPCHAVAALVASANGQH